MSNFDNIGHYASDLGLAYKSIKKLDLSKESQPEIAAKYAALKNPGSELIVKGDDNSYYLIELEDKLKLQELRQKIPKNSNNILAINFVDNAEHEQAGSLYNLSTLQGAQSLVEQAGSLLSKDNPGVDKGFKIARGSFKINITDKNGFSQAGDKDIRMHTTGHVNLTSNQINRYLNEEVLDKTSRIGLDVDTVNGKWQLGFNLRKNGREDLKNYIKEALTGQDGSYFNHIVKKVDGNIDDTLDGLSETMVRGMEASIRFDLPEDTISQILTGDMNVKEKLKELAEKGYKDEIEKALKLSAGKKEKYIPDFIFKKIAGYADKYLKNEIETYLKENEQNLSNSKNFIKEFQKTFVNTMSDTELADIQSKIKTKFSGENLQIDFDIESTVSSDTSKANFIGPVRPDTFDTEGNFILTSKGAVEFPTAKVKTDAKIDTGNISKSMVVSIADSLGQHGNSLNTMLLKDNKRIGVEAETNFTSQKTGIYNSNIEVKDFNESTYGISIKGFKGSVLTDLKDNGRVKLTSEGRMSLSEATLISNYRIKPGTTIEKIALKPSNDSPEALTVENFSADINKDGISLENHDLKTGLTLKAKTGNQKISVDINQLELKDSKIEMGFTSIKNNLISARGSGLKISGIKASINNDSISVHDISVKNGQGTLNLNKQGELTATGNGIKLNALKWQNVTASVTSEGNSTIRAHNENIEISGLNFKGNIKTGADQFEVTAPDGRINVNTKQQKLIYKTRGDKDGSFQLKSKSRDLDLSVSVPKGCTAEVDLKTNSVKIKGEKGKEFETRAELKNYAGEFTGNLNIRATDEINARFGKTFEVKASPGGVTLDGNVKINNEPVSFKGNFYGDFKYENQNLKYNTVEGKPESLEVETRNRKINLSTENKATVSLDLLKNHQPFQLETGSADSPANIVIKERNLISGKEDVNLSATLQDKVNIQFNENNDKSIALKIKAPGNAEKGISGIKVNGTVDTGSGTVNFKDLSISNSSDNSSELNISKAGLAFKNGDFRVSGQARVARDGKAFKDINFNGKAAVSDVLYDFDKNTLKLSDASFKGNINGINLNLKGGLDTGKKEANYIAEITDRGSSVKLNGNLSADLDKDKLSIRGKTGINLTAGNEKPVYYIADVSNFTVPLNDSKEVFSGSFNINSADNYDNKLKANGNLSVSSKISLQETPAGYNFKLAGANIATKDTFKTVLSQMSAILKQPQVADSLKKKGIEITGLDKLSKELYSKLLSSNLSTTSDISVNLGKDFTAKGINFNSQVNSIDMKFPVLRHTKEKGFSVEAKANDHTYKLENPVSFKGKIKTEGNRQISEVVANINLNEILPKVLNEQFTNAESPLHGKLEFKMAGNKIRIYDPQTKFFSDVSFGLQDINITLKDNKIKVDLDVNILKALTDTIKFAFSADTKIMREYHYIKDNMAILVNSKDIDHKLAYKNSVALNLNGISVDVPIVMDNKNVPVQINGDLELKDGHLTIPLKSL